MLNNLLVTYLPVLLAIGSIWTPNPVRNEGQNKGLLGTMIFFGCRNAVNLCKSIPIHPGPIPNHPGPFPNVFNNLLVTYLPVLLPIGSIWTPNPVRNEGQN